MRDVEKLKQLLEAELPGCLRKSEYLCKEDGSPSILHCAVLAGNLKSTRVLLDAGADINEQDYQGRSALMQACSEGNEEISRFLIDAGAMVNLTDHEGQNCAHYAFCMEHIELGNWLISNTDVDTSAVDADGRTPLDWKHLLDDEEDEEDLADPSRRYTQESKSPDQHGGENEDEHYDQPYDDERSHEEAKLHTAKKGKFNGAK